MIRALNYPRPMGEAVVLDLVTEYTGNPGNALIRFNPAIAREFTTGEIISLIAWYADGDDGEEDYVTLQLLPRLVDVICSDLVGCERQLEETIRDFAGSIGGQSDRFYSKFCASGRHEEWKQGRLYASVRGLDGDGDYTTGDLYIPFWMTDQLLSINHIVPLRKFKFHVAQMAHEHRSFREQDLRDEIYQSLKGFLSREGLNVRY